MSTIREVFKVVANFEQSQQKIMTDCITDTSELILDANRSQMMLGLDKEGNKILPEYTPFTIEIKKEKGQPTDRVTLKDTGDFHREMFMKVDSTSIFIDSNDEKTEKILKKYDAGSETILGIPVKKKEIINESIMDKFIKIFRLMTKL
jgi:hypothetical protein